MDKQVEEKIVQGLRTGQREAWQRLYDEYAEPLWQAATQLMGHDLSAVADVVQDTFLIAARSAQNFNCRKGSLWAWLWGIGWRQVALYYRKKTHRKKLDAALGWWNSLGGEVKDWVDGKTPKPTEVLEAQELAILVRYCLAELPRDYQKLLVAKYVDEETVDQIAKRTNNTRTAVESKLARARNAFRSVFQKMTRFKKEEGSPSIKDSKL